MWLFLRDEILMWYQLSGKSSDEKLEFRGHIGEAVQKIVQKIDNISGSREREKVRARFHQMGCKTDQFCQAQAVEGPSPPTTTVVATVQNLINQATNPQLLAKSSESYYPWF